MERKLSDLLPERYFNSMELAAAAGVLWAVGEAVRSRALDWLDQTRVDTATWGLKYWEAQYGIIPQASDTYDARRGRVKAKMRGWATVTARMLENICDSYVDGQSLVTEIPRELRLQVQFNGSFGVPENIRSVTEALLEVMPAHVAFEYLYRYLLVREVAGMTVGALTACTIDQFAFGRTAI